MLRTGSKETQRHDNNNNQKTYPQPMDETANPNKESLDTLIAKIFNNVSSLKAAYIQLQDAHTPYDPDKIQAADILVIGELMKLSELKHSYRDKNPRPASMSPQDSRLAAEIQEQQNLLKTYEVMVKKFQSQIQNRDSEIIQLQQEIQESSQRKLKLEEKLKQMGLLSKEPEESEEENHFFSVELTPALFKSAVETAYKSIHDFSKPLINMMKAAAHANDPAVVMGRELTRSIHSNLIFARKCSVVFKMKVFLLMLAILLFLLRSSFISFLQLELWTHWTYSAKAQILCLEIFARANTSCIVVHPSKMEHSFFGSLDQRDYVVSGGHPRTPFYQAFLKLAKSIWLLHRLSYSFDPKAWVFQVKGGSEFSEVHMERVVKTIVFGEQEEKPKVGLMVMPGFIVGGSVIQAQVYLSGVKSSE